MEVIQITVKLNHENQIKISCEAESILDCLKRNGLFLPAACGGKGICGKCRIQLCEGILPVTEADTRFFLKEELEHGYRLACEAYPTQDCTIALFEAEQDFMVVTQHSSDISVIEDVEYSIVIDLGTTTIAMQRIGMQSKKVYDTYTTINHQRSYGADVISRIEAANSGKADELRRLVLEDLKQGILQLCQNEQQIVGIYLAGNTTMIHLLMGYSCEKLGTYPFEAVELNCIKTTYAQVFSVCKVEETYKNLPVTILPGISAFVGADIMAGMLTCGFFSSKQTIALIDLGTNGEMAIGNRDRILVASTAAGPAFEAGNISCGVGSVKGAISHVTIEGDAPVLQTIEGACPIGICGTGVIDTVYELRKEHLLDETGLFEEKYFETGYPLADAILFIQKDVRELQLAKAAIRAGFEALTKEYGVTYDEIDKIYIAGGFGYKLDLEKAVGIGLFPKECSGKLEAIGNSSLAGLIQYATEKDAEKTVAAMREKICDLQLANLDLFHTCYLENMNFE